MVSRPIHIFSPSELDIVGSHFRAQCLAWMDQVRLEMKETIGLTKKTIVQSRALMVEADRMLARR
jgi:hypothetical protein